MGQLRTYGGAIENIRWDNQESVLSDQMAPLLEDDTTSAHHQPVLTGDYILDKFAPAAKQSSVFYVGKVLSKDTTAKWTAHAGYEYCL